MFGISEKYSEHSIKIETELRKKLNRFSDNVSGTTKIFNRFKTIDGILGSYLVLRKETDDASPYCDKFKSNLNQVGTFVGAWSRYINRFPYSHRSTSSYGLAAVFSSYGKHSTYVF